MVFGLIAKGFDSAINVVDDVVNLRLPETEDVKNVAVSAAVKTVAVLAALETLELLDD
jgi:hypothetical protein